MRTPTGAHYTRALVASVRHLRGIPVYSEQRRQAEGWLTCDDVARLLNVDPKTVRRAVARNELPVTQPLPCGPHVFANNDIVGSEAAQRVADRAHSRRMGNRAGPTDKQLSLEISNT